MHAIAAMIYGSITTDCTNSHGDIAVNIGCQCTSGLSIRILLCTQALTNEIVTVTWRYVSLYQAGGVGADANPQKTINELYIGMLQLETLEVTYIPHMNKSEPYSAYYQ